MNITENTSLFLEKVKTFIEGSPWKGEYLGQVEKYQFDLGRSCELAVVGTVKAGKSSFINTLLGEDLAVVNVTEATATINYFKYAGNEEEKDKVFVVYTDGHTEWKDKFFLDSLQGNSPEVLERSKNIDHLEIFIDNKILKEITLIDTPGTGSVVQAHTSVVEKYGKEDQAQRNIRESYRLMNKADAVILLVARVPKENDLRNVELFTEKTIPYNSVGVMSKTDIDIEVGLKEWTERCEKIQCHLQDRLHSIHPVSAALYKAVSELDRNGILRKFHEVINGISHPGLVKTFENGTARIQLHSLISEDNNASETGNLRAKLFSSKEEEVLSGCGLGHSIRTEMVEAIRIPTVRTIVLSELWGKDYETAFSNLVERSGFVSVKHILETQFFSRARAIRCHSILRKLKHLLSKINYNNLSELKKHSEYKDYYLSVINRFSGSLGNYASETDRILKSFKKLVEKNTVSKEEIEDLSNAIENLIRECDTLLGYVEESNNKAEALQLLETHRNLFLPYEIEELELLFGKFPERVSELMSKFDFTRGEHWNDRSRLSKNSAVSRICHFAYLSWSNILSNHEAKT